jgi:Spy/CpxP family protein refolding chaperone
MAIASAATFADDEEAKQGDGDRMALMQKNLGLNDEQVAQIRQTRDNGGSREEILAVLTDEQRALLKERRAQMKGQGRKGGRRVPAEDVQNTETTDG